MSVAQVMSPEIWEKIHDDLMPTVERERAEACRSSRRFRLIINIVLFLVVLIPSACELIKHAFSAYATTAAVTPALLRSELIKWFDWRGGFSQHLLELSWAIRNTSEHKLELALERLMEMVICFNQSETTAAFE